MFPTHTKQLTKLLLCISRSSSFEKEVCIIIVIDLDKNKYFRMYSLRECILFLLVLVPNTYDIFSDDLLHTVLSHFVVDFGFMLRGSIQKLPDWPPGASTANGRALCQ